MSSLKLRIYLRSTVLVSFIIAATLCGRCAASPRPFFTIKKNILTKKLFPSILVNQDLYSDRVEFSPSDGDADKNLSKAVVMNRTSESIDQQSTTSTKLASNTRKRKISFWRKDSVTKKDSTANISKNETAHDRNQTDIVDTQHMSKLGQNRTQEEAVITSTSSNMTHHAESSPSSTVSNTTSVAPSFILVQRSPRQLPMSYYKGGLATPPLHSPPPTESGLVVIVSALLPILSKLILLLLLSGSSIFFGPSDVHPIYSPNPTQHFMLERVNDRYSRDDIAFQRAIRFPPTNKPKRIWNMILNRRRRALKRSLDSVQQNDSIIHQDHKRNDSLYTRTVLIVDVHTDDIHNTVEYLRDAVSFILHQYHSTDTRLDFGTELEVVFNVESPGGVVQDYGLAADQIARLRNSRRENGDLIVTVCVDKVAASGGYMIACQSSPNQLFAAPLAIVGSIGVLRETLNIYDVLTKYGIRPLLIKAGKAKVPITSTNEVTKEGLAFVQKNVDSTHEVFKKMVLEQRGNVIQSKHISEVTSGDIFLGTNALALGLVDRLITSDEYIAEKVSKGDRVLRLQKYDKSRAGMRFSPLDLLLSHKDSFLQGKLQWFQKFSPVLVSLLKLALSARLFKALELV